MIHTSIPDRFREFITDIQLQSLMISEGPVFVMPATGQPFAFFTLQAFPDVDTGDFLHGIHQVAVFFSLLITIAIFQIF